MGEVGSAAGGFSQIRQAIQARGKFTRDGPSAMRSTAPRKIAKQPGRRLRLFISGEALTQHKPDEDCKSADGNVWDVGEESCGQVEGRDSLEENSPVEIALPQKESHDPIQTINNAK